MNDVAVVMIEGFMTITTEESSQRLEQGGHYLLPGALKYTTECALPCTFLAWRQKPFDILCADPKDDPRRQAK